MSCCLSCCSFCGSVWAHRQLGHHADHARLQGEAPDKKKRWENHGFTRRHEDVMGFTLLICDSYVNGLVDGRIYRKPARFSHEIWDFAIIFPLNQSIDYVLTDFVR